MERMGYKYHMQVWLHLKDSLVEWVQIDIKKAQAIQDGQIKLKILHQ